MSRHAVPLHDLDRVWLTPMGKALVEAVLDDEGEGRLVTIRGEDALVLTGTPPRVSALVAGLLRARFPGPRGRAPRVYGDEGAGWRRITTPPEVAELPDDRPGFDDGAAEEALLHV